MPAATLPKLGSFRYHFQQKSKERLPLLSSLKIDDLEDLGLETDVDGGKGCLRRARDRILWIWGQARVAALIGLDFARSDHGT
ncbi:hypothetical protein HPP92_024529 [Vanilla planifolia]|uniref:Uncharacterized protein n=1 Tax=Vanilla planifolia TaxID=51239 RepID=A0A835PMJ7_VANPL|nr:hypothetical protein HPP92_024521 [Vanilla planifolia]KAG0456741.1 hypothetical protein HPP92_024529 [Vanilla planifolia]